LTIKEEEIRIVYVWCVYFAYVDIIMYEINNNLKHTHTHTHDCISSYVILSVARNLSTYNIIPNRLKMCFYE